jgi:hypothetical protein
MSAERDPLVYDGINARWRVPRSAHAAIAVVQTTDQRLGHDLAALRPLDLARVGRVAVQRWTRRATRPVQKCWQR